VRMTSKIYETQDNLARDSDTRAEFRAYGD
jgi:hypothetical protein